MSPLNPARRQPVGPPPAETTAPLADITQLTLNREDNVKLSLLCDIEAILEEREDDAGHMYKVKWVEYPAAQVSKHRDGCLDGSCGN